MLQHSRQILAVVAHPDDEVLGCGGALAWHAKRGDDVAVVILADGETSRGAEKSQVAVREAAAREAMAILGVRRLFTCNLPDNQLDTCSRLSIAQQVDHYVKELRPDVVYTHHAGDLNIDHRITHEAVAVACRPQSGHSVKKLLCFEIPSSTEWRLPGSGSAFDPNFFVDISAVFDTKIKALRAYHEEMRDWPHPRSYPAVEHLARWRGATVGCSAAEAFMLGRAIWSDIGG